MPYTIWSRDRLLGHTTLGYAPSIPGIKAGDFEPTELGEQLMPVLTGMGPASEALSRAIERIWPHGLPDSPPGIQDAIRKSSEYADLVSINDRLESLALELRDPAGIPVRTEAIGIQDTEHLLALARRDGILTEEDEMEMASEPWEPYPARYQIIVELPGAREAVLGERNLSPG